MNFYLMWKDWKNRDADKELSEFLRDNSDVFWNMMIVMGLKSQTQKGASIFS